MFRLYLVLFLAALVATASRADEPGKTKEKELVPAKDTFNHLGSDRKLLERVTLTYYEAGHMMYVHKPSLVKLKKDIATFMTSVP